MDGNYQGEEENGSSIFLKFGQPILPSKEFGQLLLRRFNDGYYVAYNPITLSCIFFMFIEMKFIHFHSCVMFAMKSMSTCND